MTIGGMGALAAPPHHSGHMGHGGGGRPVNWRPWWRGWNGLSNSFPVPVVVETPRDNTPLYFLGGAVILGALILSRR